MREGWFDVNIWPLFIDHLLIRSTTLTVVRKEVAIISRRQDGTIPKNSRRYDGIFHYIRGHNMFDLGVIEVSPPSMYFEGKHFIDRAKIVAGLSALITYLKSLCLHVGLQVIGILCSGWSVSLFRMWIGPDGKLIYKEHPFFISCAGELFKENFLFIQHLVRYVELAFSVASFVESSLIPIPE